MGVNECRIFREIGVLALWRGDGIATETLNPFLTTCRGFLLVAFDAQEALVLLLIEADTLRLGMVDRPGAFVIAEVGQLDLCQPVNRCDVALIEV
jgi:hypothetical protein